MAIEFSHLGIRELSHGDQCGGFMLKYTAHHKKRVFYPQAPRPHIVSMKPQQIWEDIHSSASPIKTVN